MNPAAASVDHIRAIHALARRAGLDEEARRAVIERATGKRSSKDLTAGEAGRVIEDLKALVTPRHLIGDNRPVKSGLPDLTIRTAEARQAALRGGHVAIDGPFGPKLKALWLTAWNLGLLADRTDRALLAFVERQTGLSHTRWLKDAVEASKAIEGLKAWIARAGGVRWPHRDAASPQTLKLAVIAAQRARLVEVGRPASEGDVDTSDLDAAMQTLGRRLRKAVGHK